MADAVLNGIGIGQPLDGSLFVRAMELQQRRVEHKDQMHAELNNYALKQQQEADKAAASELERQNHQDKIVGDAFKDVPTTSQAIQPVINEHIVNNLKELSENIKGSKYKTDGDAYTDAAVMANKIKEFSGKANEATAFFDQQAAQMGPGIDGKAVAKAAATKYFSKIDKDGKQGMAQSPEDLGDPQKVWADVLKENTSAFVQPGQLSLKSDLQGLQKIKAPINTVHSDPNKSIKGELYPYEEVVKDKDGDIIDKRVKSEASNLVPKSINEDQRMVTDDVMKMMSPGTILEASADVDKYIKQNKLDPKIYNKDNPAYDILLKAQLYRNISSISHNNLERPGKSSETAAQRNLENGITQAIKQMGYEFQKQARADKDAASASKADEDTKEFNKNPIAIGIRAINNDEALLNGLPMINIDGKPHYNLSSVIGALNAQQDEKGKNVGVLGVYKRPGSQDIVMKFKSPDDAAGLIGEENVPYFKREGKAKEKQDEYNKEHGGYSLAVSKDIFKGILKQAAPLNKLAPEDVDKLDAGYKKPATTVTKGASPESGGYSNIQESNVGTIGVKNGKWYNVKTGKPL